MECKEIAEIIHSTQIYFDFRNVAAKRWLHDVDMFSSAQSSFNIGVLP